MAVLQEPTDAAPVPPITYASSTPDGTAHPPVSVTVIEPRSGWSGLNLAEVWAYRDLLFTLALRDVKLRYRQTALGAIWVVMQPILTALIFNIVFGLLAKLPSDGKPYFLLALAGSMGWQAFSTTLLKANTSLVGNANLISKIYFPRLVLPLSTVFSTLIDAGVTLAVMLPLLLIFKVWPTFAILLVPFWLLMLMTMAVGIGLYVGALTVTYRDIQYITPVVIQLMMYATPVGYSIAAAPAGLPKFAHLFWALNPLTGLLEGLRWSLLGTTPPSLGSVLYGVGFAVVIMVGGAFAFRRMERRFADVI